MISWKILWAPRPALIFLYDILLFIAGLAMLRAHNIWTGGWPVLVAEGYRAMDERRAIKTLLRP